MMDESGMFSVRIANLSDAFEIKILLFKQFNEHGIELSKAQLGKAVDGFITDECWGFFLVAEESGQLVGFACVTITWTLENGGKSAWLDELFVIPDKRNQGIGTELLNRSIGEARKMGCKSVDLEVDKAHQRAENLYSRVGFQPHDRKRWFLKLE